MSKRYFGGGFHVMRANEGIDHRHCSSGDHLFIGGHGGFHGFTDGQLSLKLFDFH